MDLHQWVVDEVKSRFDMDIPRRIAKNVGFGILYGAGGGAISAQAGISYDEAVSFKSMYLKALPSLRDLMNAVQERGRSGGAITTLGGRRYPVEPRKIVKGEWRTFEYKLLNYLMRHPERVHSRAQLLDKVWGDHVFIEERTVDVHVKRLREALGGAAPLIETVRGVGYRITAQPAQAASRAAA